VVSAGDDDACSRPRLMGRPDRTPTLDRASPEALSGEGLEDPLGCRLREGAALGAGLAVANEPEARSVELEHLELGGCRRRHEESMTAIRIARKC
jgi:hypothetical protein